jgi:hypothetical protein
MPTTTPGRMAQKIDRLSATNRPRCQYATAVSSDSATRTSASPARNSCFTMPWLLNSTASGGPEMVVTE